MIVVGIAQQWGDMQCYMYSVDAYDNVGAENNDFLEISAMLEDILLRCVMMQRWAKAMV